MTQIQLTTLLFVAGAAWLLLLVINGVAVKLQWLKYMPTVASAVLVAVGAFEHWLWKLPLVRRTLAAKRPVLSGTWRARIRPTTPAGRAGNPASIDAFMAVRQTYSTVTMQLLTAESASETLAGTLVRAADGIFEVFAVYRNTPRLSVRTRSPIHFGALRLQVHDDPVNTLAGHYWTDRDSMGELELTDRRSALVSTFDAGTRLFAISPGAQPGT